MLFSALRNTLFWRVVDTRVIFPIMIVKRRLKDWGQKSGSLVFSLTWFLTNCAILDNVFSFGMFLFISLQNEDNEICITIVNMRHR